MTNYFMKNDERKVQDIALLRDAVSTHRDVNYELVIISDFISPCALSSPCERRKEIFLQFKELKREKN